jgi:hypothetical protein
VHLRAAGCWAPPLHQTIGSAAPMCVRPPRPECDPDDAWQRDGVVALMKQGCSTCPLYSTIFIVDIAARASTKWRNSFSSDTNRLSRATLTVTAHRPQHQSRSRRAT